VKNLKNGTNVVCSCIIGWSKYGLNMFYSSHHKPILRVVLDPITISKMVSESLQDSLRHLLSGFCYRTNHHVFAIELHTIYVHKPSTIVLVVRVCVKESHIWQINVAIAVVMSLYMNLTWHSQFITTLK